MEWGVVPQYAKVLEKEKEVIIEALNNSIMIKCQVQIRMEKMQHQANHESWDAEAKTNVEKTKGVNPVGSISNLFDHRNPLLI